LHVSTLVVVEVTLLDVQPADRAGARPYLHLAAIKYV